MAYATVHDLENAAGGRDRLVQIADRDGDGEPDAALIAAAQAKAEGLIDSYAGKRYSVPVANPSAMLIQIAAEETIYQLLVRNPPGVTDDDRDERDRRLDWLKDLATGKVVPSDPLPAKSPTVRAGYHPSKRAMSRDRSKGFW